LMAGGTRYHAHFVPDEELTAELYLAACERLNAAGIRQYEISNFAHAGCESLHNLKYWTRQPYLGFGVDAHSMLPIADVRDPGVSATQLDAVRWSTPDQLEEYVAGKPGSSSTVTSQAALEESFFLGLRLNRGVPLHDLEQRFGAASLRRLDEVIAQTVADGLLEKTGDTLRLTPRGRLLSNEVFERFLGEPTQAI